MCIGCAKRSDEWISQLSHSHDRAAVVREQGKAGELGSSGREWLYVVVTVRPHASPARGWGEKRRTGCR